MYSGTFISFVKYVCYTKYVLGFYIHFWDYLNFTYIHCWLQKSHILLCTKTWSKTKYDAHIYQICIKCTNPTFLHPNEIQIQCKHDERRHNLTRYLNIFSFCYKTSNQKYISEYTLKMISVLSKISENIHAIYNLTHQRSLS